MKHRVLSVFISSTFSDMHFERDYLKMHVFPQINEELKKYSISLRVVDLRWGINTFEQTQESIESKVIRVCFDEIDRSRPFFIGLIGNRYGWIPPLSSDIEFHGKYLLEGNSITSMEIEYAILQQSGIAGCVFMERDASCLGDMDADVREQYDDAYSSDAKIRDENPLKIQKLKQHIKQRLHQDGKEDCYHQYCPIWNGKEFEGLDEFGDVVKRTMLREVLSLYSQNVSEEPFKDEFESQDNYLSLKLATAYNRNSLLQELIKKIKEAKGVLAINGISGIGKSCTYALLVDYFTKYPDDYIVLYHTTSTGMSGRDLYHMLERWNYQLETAAQIAHIECDNIKDTITYFVNLLKKASGTRKILMFVDATDGFISDDYTEYLSFYPRALNDKWLMICTTTPDYVNKIVQYHRSAENFVMPLLAEVDARAIIDRFYSYNRKELYSQNLSRLLEKEHNGVSCYSSPLWLNIALNFLLSLSAQDFLKICAESDDFNYGLINYINHQIDSFPESEEELFRNFLLNLKKFYGDLPIRLFNLLSLSYNGLDEKTIETMLGEEWNPLNFAIVRSFFRDFLVEQGDRKTWQIMHQKCKIKVSNAEAESICKQLSSYYIEQIQQGENVSDNLWYYIFQSRDSELAERYLRLSKNELDNAKQEIWQTCLVADYYKVLQFLFGVYNSRHKHFFVPTYFYYWELKEIVVSLARQYNKTGKHNEAISCIDAFYVFIKNQNFSGDAKSILCILTESERERASEYVCNREEQKEAYRRAISRASIRGPFSLLLAPIAHKYYKWRIFKLLNNE